MYTPLLGHLLTMPSVSSSTLRCTEINTKKKILALRLHAQVSVYLPPFILPLYLCISLYSFNSEIQLNYSNSFDTSMHKHFA